MDNIRAARGGAAGSAGVASIVQVARTGEADLDGSVAVEEGLARTRQRAGAAAASK